MRIMICYGTSEGQTRKVAESVADRFRSAGHAVTLVDVVREPNAPRVAGFDAAIIAGRVHAGLYQRQIVRFVRGNRATLDTIPNAFLSVSMSAAKLAPGDEGRLQAYVAGFVRRSGWTPARIVHVAGARLYTRHGPIGRWILGLVDGRRFATDRDHEWTDWTALAKFADDFAAAAATVRSEVTVAARAPVLDAMD